MTQFKKFTGLILSTVTITQTYFFVSNIILFGNKIRFVLELYVFTHCFRCALLTPLMEHVYFPIFRLLWLFHVIRHIGYIGCLFIGFEYVALNSMSEHTLWIVVVFVLFVLKKKQDAVCMIITAVTCFLNL